MSKKKIISGIIIAVIAIAALYWFVLRKKSAVDAMPAVNAADQTAYDALYNLLNANISSTALQTWLGDIAKEFYTGIRPVTTDYLINGKITKTAALLAAWASSYYGRDTYQFNKPMNEINEAAYNIFYGLKGQQNRL